MSHYLVETSVPAGQPLRKASPRVSRRRPHPGSGTRRPPIGQVRHRLRRVRPRSTTRSLPFPHTGLHPPRPVGDEYWRGRTRSHDAPRGRWWGESRRDSPGHGPRGLSGQIRSGFLSGGSAGIAFAHRAAPAQRLRRPPPGSVPPELSVATGLGRLECAMPTLLWMECGACSGESMAILGAEGPGREGDDLPDFLESCHVQLLWHPSLSLESPREVERLIGRIVSGEQELTLLCVEGSIIHGPDGTGMFDTFCGRPKRDIIADLCDRADFVLAMGTCAAFGGIPAAPPNPTESSGLQFSNDRPGGLLGPHWRSRAGYPVLNLSGCPVNAATMITTMEQ